MIHDDQKVKITVWMIVATRLRTEKDDLFGVAGRDDTPGYFWQKVNIIGYLHK
jgi:hypothetical protein